MRPFLVWRDDWLLGYDEVDEQHLALAGKLNELHRFLVHDASRPQGGLDQLCHQLTELFEMTRQHFRDEEALMEFSDYPGLNAHHREHAMLLAEMQECMREIEAGSRTFSLQTLTALKYWQIDHVLNSDQEFVAYLVNRADMQERPRTVTTPPELFRQTHLSRH
ncbi:MAG: hemerythrin family protein [Candidatus Thiodiazotropha sp.]